MATIADLFHGHRRARYFGLLNLVTGLAAVVFIAASGALGNGNWRIPFWLYLLAIPLAVLALLGLTKDTTHPKAAALPKVDWHRLTVPIIFTVVGGAVFYVPVAMLSFRLSDLGVDATSAIGAISAGAALALALASLTFPALLRRIPRILLALALALLGVGLLLIGLSAALPVVIIGAVIANAGGGVLLSTLQTWIVQGLPYEQRGRAAGASTAGLFIGQFIAPVVILGAVGRPHLAPAIAIAGGIGLITALVGAIIGKIHPETPDAALLGSSVS
jgi:MFS family permease